MAEKNLDGVRVLDFTRVLAGPYMTQMLCDLGAEVIKVEQPGLGADERNMPPLVNGQSGYFMMLNRGKQSITLNLKKSQSKEIIDRLVRQSDIVVENFKPGVMESLGFSYEKLKEVKPDIIMCSISTFGQEGPDAKKVGYDIVAQAASGLMWMTGDTDRPPMRSGTSIGDVNAGSHALAATLSALYFKEKTGRGQHIDMSLRDCLSAILEAAIPRYLMTNGEDNPHRSGAYHPQMGPYGVFDCGNDQFVTIGALNDALWSRLCKVIEREDLIDDPAFNTNQKRGCIPESRDALTLAIETWLKKIGDSKKAAAFLSQANVPAAAVFTIPDLLADEQFLSRDMLVKVDDPVFGEVVLPATPMRFSETTVFNDVPPPLLGQHTESILKSLGLDDGQIDALKADGVFER